MPYNVNAKTVNELSIMVNELRGNYSEGRVKFEDASLVEKLGLFGSKVINSARIDDIGFAEQIFKTIFKAGEILGSQWDKNINDKKTHLAETKLFLQRTIHGCLLFDVFNIRDACQGTTRLTTTDYKNSDLVKGIFAILDISCLSEVSREELRDNFLALERYMEIVQEQNQDEAIRWHPTKTLEELIAALKTYIIECSEKAEAPAAGMTV